MLNIFLYRLKSFNPNHILHLNVGYYQFKQEMFKDFGFWILNYCENIYTCSQYISNLMYM